MRSLLKAVKRATDRVCLVPADQGAGLGGRSCCLTAPLGTEPQRKRPISAPRNGGHSIERDLILLPDQTTCTEDNSSKGVSGTRRAH